MSTMNLWRATEKLRASMHEEFPKLKIKEKKGIFHKLLGLIFGAAYMRAATVLGNTIWTPKDLFNDQFRAYRVLLHERQHLRDARDMGKIYFAWQYASPQVWSLLAILAIIIPGTLVTPYALIGLIVPCTTLVLVRTAPARVELEIRGYTANLTVYRVLDRPVDLAVDKIVSNLSSRLYLWAVTSDEMKEIIKDRLYAIADKAPQTKLGMEVREHFLQ